MPVMKVGEMRVTVSHGQVMMLVGVRLHAIPLRTVIVVMMLIVTMMMSMSHGIVMVLVLMLFGNMKPNTQCHQDHGRPEHHGEWLPKQGQCQQAPYEGSAREVSTRPCRAHVT